MNKILITLGLFLCVNIVFAQEKDTTSLFAVPYFEGVSDTVAQAEAIADTVTENATVENTIVNSLQTSTDTSQWLVPFRDSVICYAEKFIGKPYHYGSKGPDAFDCSGFTGFVFAHFGITLASSSTAQYKESPRYVPIDSAMIGDLIFFMGRNGRSSVGHVGIITDVDTANHSCQFIHAATHGGIILTNYPSYAYYNQRYMGIGRYNLPEYVVCKQGER